MVGRTVGFSAWVSPAAAVQESLHKASKGTAGATTTTFEGLR